MENLENKGLGIEVSQTLETAQIYKAPIKMQNIYGAGSPNNGYEGDFLPDGHYKELPIAGDQKWMEGL